MTDRPKPRKSALAGQSPITPTPVTPETPETPASPPRHKREPKQKITITINADLADRSRGMYLQQLANGGPQTWSRWIEEAIRQQLNKSAPAASVQPGIIPTGRPVNLDER